MPDTGAKDEITRLANAKEAETVHESKTLASKTKQHSAKDALANRARGLRNASSKRKTHAKDQAQEDQEASRRMVDEGDPNRKP